jgi:hypothetical protein
MVSHFTRPTQRLKPGKSRLDFRLFSQLVSIAEWFAPMDINSTKWQ